MVARSYSHAYYAQGGKDAKSDKLIRVRTGWLQSRLAGLLAASESALILQGFPFMPFLGHVAYTFWLQVAASVRYHCIYALRQ